MEAEASGVKTCKITVLPPEILELIFRNLTFDNIGKIRPVNQYFNTIASSLLNSEFSRLRMNMLHRFHSIKAQMPRRESARRKHPLARESDIIETLHMRLTLLHMTFGKHIERKHCCFFAGEILDEVYRILHYVKTTPSLNRAYKVTDELFDLSTMAMEYFKEHIEPSLPEIAYFATDFLEYTPTITSSPKTQVSLLEESVVCTSSVVSKLPALETVPSCHTPVSLTVNKKLRRLRDSVKKNCGDITAIKQELKLARRKIVSQQKQINEYKSRSEDYDRKFQNTSRKLSAILQELNRFKTEFQYWRSKSPATSCACGTVTPVLESRDSDMFASDMSIEKMSPKIQEDLVEDAKSFVSDLGSLPSCSTVSSTRSRGHASERAVVSIDSPAIDAQRIKNVASAEEYNDKSSLKAGKRKLEVDGSQAKSHKVQLSDSSSFKRAQTYSSADENCIVSKEKYGSVFLPKKPLDTISKLTHFESSCGDSECDEWK